MKKPIDLKKHLGHIFVIILIFVLAAVLLAFLRGDEDTWILDDQGEWVKHGNPDSGPQITTEINQK